MTVKVALAGIGNCVSSLVQGVEYYREAVDDEQVPGLMHVRLGGHHVGDLEFVAAFEVDADKAQASFKDGLLDTDVSNASVMLRAAALSAGDGLAQGREG